MQQCSVFRSPVPNREYAYMCQAVTTVRELFSPQFPFLQRVRSMKSASLAMLKVENTCIWETLQACCEEHCFVADAAVLRLPGILSLPGITLPSIELLPCWKKNTFALVQCLAKAVVKQSRLQQSTVLKKGHHAGERTILFRVSIFAKGQINEECLLRNVES